MFEFLKRKTGPAGLPAGEGENIGVLLRGVERGQVSPGDLLTGP